jgi:hypothetical protein
MENNGLALSPEVPARTDAPRSRIAAVNGGGVTEDGHSINLSVAFEDGAVRELSFDPEGAAACRAIMADLIREARKLRATATPPAPGTGSSTIGAARFPSAW